MSYDFETLASGAVAYRPWRHDRDRYDIKITGSGTPATDTTAMQAAATQFDSWGGGTLWIEGTVQLSGYVDFQSAVSLRGVGRDACIESMDQSWPISWDRGWSWADGGTHSFTMADAFAEKVNTTGYNPSRGDWIILYSNDSLPGVTHFSPNGVQRPMELHQVHHFDAANDDIYVADFVVDDMQTSPTCSPVAMFQNILVDNLRFKIADSFTTASSYANFLTICGCEGMVIRNCHFDRLCVGSINIKGCGNLLIDGCTLDGMMNDDNATPNLLYGIAVAGSNGVVVNNTTISGFRHSVTTSALYAADPVRQGTILNFIVQNRTVNAPVKYDNDTTFQTMTALDTHAEGWGVIFRDNIINVQGHTSNVGVTNESRRTIIRGNTIRGGYNASGVPAGKGIVNYGPDCEIVGNSFERLWSALQTARFGQYETASDNCTIEGNTFKDCTAVPIWLADGDSHRVIGNRFDNCGTTTGGNPQSTKAHIQLGELQQFACTFEDAGTTLTITANTLFTHDASDTDKYEGMQIFFTDQVSSPDSVTENAIYYVKDTISDTTCTISATYGGSAVTFAPGGGTATCHGNDPPGTGHLVCNNVSVKGSNDHFIETNNKDEDDIEVYGNTVVGYAGAAFSDRYSHDTTLQAKYAALNPGM
jgi:parallel beta-helix repeat protein